MREIDCRPVSTCMGIGISLLWEQNFMVYTTTCTYTLYSMPVPWIASPLPLASCGVGEAANVTLLLFQACAVGLLSASRLTSLHGDLNAVSADIKRLDATSYKV